MDLADFDFALPDDRIALRPASPRDAARMLVVWPDGRLDHAQVRDLPQYVTAGDALVVNDTRVMAARLRGVRRRDTDARIEVLLHRRLTPNRFSVLARPALRKFRDRMNPPPTAPLLGLNGIVLKCHGGATDRDFTQAIRVAVDLARSDFAGEIERNLRRLPAALAVSTPPGPDGDHQPQSTPEEPTE